RIEEAIWRDLFHDGDWKRSIAIELRGDGIESRSLQIMRGVPQFSLPFDGNVAIGTGFTFPTNDTGIGGLSVDESEQVTNAITLVWHDHTGREYVVRPRVGQSGIEFPTTGEDLPDFFFFAAGLTPSATENATRFSEMSRFNEALDFTSHLSSQFE